MRVVPSHFFLSSMSFMSTHSVLVSVCCLPSGHGECELCDSSCKTCSAAGRADCSSCYSGKHLLSVCHTSFWNQKLFSGLVSDVLGKLVIKVHVFSLASSARRMKESTLTTNVVDCFVDNLCVLYSFFVSAVWFAFLCSGRFLTARQTCTSRCPSGTFANKASSQCEECSKGCAMCQEAQQCQRCRSGLYLHNGACVVECQRCLSCFLISWHAHEHSPS